MIPVISLPAPAPHSIAVSVAHVPFYSQFKDISSKPWQKVGCGVTSLAMVIDFYEPKAVTVNNLLKQAIAEGAYDSNAGWKHKDLIALAGTYGLNGKSYDLTSKDSVSAFITLKSYLVKGPVIVSVHYKFDPKSTIPHMVVVEGVNNDTLYYNDPASKVGQQQISTANFLKGWKKKLIVIAPATAPKIALNI